MEIIRFYGEFVYVFRCSVSIGCWLFLLRDIGRFILKVFFFVKLIYRKVFMMVSLVLEEGRFVLRSSGFFIFK